MDRRSGLLDMSVLAGIGRLIQTRCGPWRCFRPPWA